MKGTHQLVRLGLAALALAIGCAKERPVKHILENSLRVQKADLTGTFSYLRTIVDSKYTANNRGLFLPSGLHESSDSLVQFVIKKDLVEITAVDPLYNSEATARYTSVLASFPVRHVDVLRKQNPDGTDTHEEEETTDRRPWKEREFMVFDLANNRAELSDLLGVKSTALLSGINIDRDSGHLDFTVEKTLETNAVITERFSFLKFNQSATYTQRLYPKDLQQRFGVFKTRTYQFDKFGRALQSLVVEVMNRWDTLKTVVYYLTKNFPEHLKPVAHSVFNEWNKALAEATGHNVLELRDNSGQELGDLRYSMVAVIDGNEANGLLGYGPSVANPRTGEIIKADVFLYGGSLRKAVYREREWTRMHEIGLKKNHSTTSSKSFAGRLDRFLADPKFKPLRASFVMRPDLVREVLDTVRSPQGTFDSQAILAKARAQVMGKGREFTTPLSSETLGLVSHLAAASFSDEEIEVKVFAPLLAHELGHTLGLRHNFMGSSDTEHFHGDAKTSSVMDYSFLSVDEPMGPGKYDSAAIRVIYGNGSDEVMNRELSQNYLYCTDENVFDSRAGICLQFDKGGSLVDVAKNQVVNYFKNHRFSNLRNDRVSFPDFGSYLNRILITLYPIRVVYDHANAIMTAGAAYIEGSRVAPTTSSDAMLWSLLRQRVEAGPNSQNTRPLQLSEKLTVTLDVDKMRSAAKDAQSARGMAFTCLRTIILDNSPGRPDLDSGDIQYNELQVRGVLSDKIYALLFLMMPTWDPSSMLGTVMVFDQFHRPMAQMLNDLISNTTLDPIEGLKIGVVNINLRYVALELFEAFSKVATISSGELLDLIQLKKVLGQPVAYTANAEAIKELATELEKLRGELSKAQLKVEVNNPTPEAQKKVEELQRQVLAMHVELSQRQLQSLVGEVDPDAKSLVKNSALRAEIIELMIKQEVMGPNEEDQKKAGELFENLIQNNVTQVEVSDGQVLKAPLTFNTFGELETGSGRLLFFNLNLIEDRAKIIRGMLPRVELSVLMAKTEEEKAQLAALKDQLLEQQLLFERYISLEKRFTQRLYDVYRS